MKYRLQSIRSYTEPSSLKKALIKLIDSGDEMVHFLAHPSMHKLFGYIPDYDSGSNQKLSRAIKSLLDRGYVTQKDGNIYLTAKGILYCNKVKIEEFALPTHRPTWDGHWHLVMFDVPEGYKQARDSFRKKIMDLGYYPLQQSVYVYPFDYHQEIKQLAKLHDVAIDILTMQITRIDNENTLKKEFGL